MTTPNLLFKAKSLLAALCAMAAFALPTLHAQTPADKPAPHADTAEGGDEEGGKANKKDERGVLRDPMRRIKWDHGKPNLNARYYIIIRMNQPVYTSRVYGLMVLSRTKDLATIINKYYKETRKDKRVEIVLFTNENAHDNRYMTKQCKIKCAVGGFRDDDLVLGLPGFATLSSNCAVFVRASDGAVLRQSTAADILSNWRDLVTKDEGSEAGGAQ